MIPRASLLAVLLLGLAPTLGLQASAHPPEVLSPAAEQATADEVKAFRADLQRSIRDKDAAGLRRMYAPGFVHTHSSGKLDGRDARIVAALAGDPIIETAPVEDLEIRVPGGWTAIATGRSPLRSSADGRTYDFRWMAVYVRLGDGWALAASQATRLGEVASQ
jgi:ketosteroid isomerase-like protein